MLGHRRMAIQAGRFSQQQSPSNGPSDCEQLRRWRPGEFLGSFGDAMDAFRLALVVMKMLLISLLVRRCSARGPNLVRFAVGVG